MKKLFAKLPCIACGFLVFSVLSCVQGDTGLGQCQKLFVVSAEAAKAPVKTEVIVQERKSPKGSYKYPEFVMANKTAQRLINNVVLSKIEKAMASDMEDKDVLEAGSRFELALDNEKYLCFSLQFHDYRGGAHGMYFTGYQVFDKKTGEELPYTKFVPAIDKEDLLFGLRNQLFEVKNAGGDDSMAPFADENIWVSDNYRLNQDGSISLVYGPYALDCYAMGDCYVKINKQILNEVKKYRKQPEKMPAKG